MREDAFRAHLAPRLGGTAVVSSYVSNARLIEKRLGVDLDRLDLSDGAIAAIRLRLIDAGVAARKASDAVSALRHYTRMSAGRPDDPPRQSESTALACTEERSRPAIVADASVAELVLLYGNILAELRDRGVLRTANGPVGDYAEHLFAQAFGWTLAGNSAVGVDAVDATGARYQIKGRRLDTPRSARQLSAIRRLDDDAFDVLAIILFDHAMRVRRAALVPKAIVTDRATYISHTNSWRMMAPDRLWEQPGVADVTAALRGAA